MSYNKEWNITITRKGNEYEYSSPNGKAVIRNEEDGWVVRGELLKDRYDARPMAKTPYKEDDYKQMETVCRNEENRLLYKAGKFEQGGMKAYIEARGYAWSRICLTPVRVPYEVAMKNDMGEGSRDKAFFEKRLAEYADARKTMKELQDDERFNKPEEAYRLLVLEGFKIPTPPKPAAEKPAKDAKQTKRVKSGDKAALPDGTARKSSAELQAIADALKEQQRLRDHQAKNGMAVAA